MLRLDYNARAMALLAGFAKAGRIPHALLLEGPAGCGKKTMARIVAQAALCTAGEKPCGVCGPCVKVEKQVHPDVCFYTVPEGKKEFPVEQVREIRAQAYVTPNEGVCKVYILDKAHTMNTAAQNALLKLIEEPPEFVRFILLSENRSRMLPTILSRVTSVELEVPSVEQCEQTLRSLAPQRDPGLLKAAAAGAAGNIGRALSLLETAKPSKAAADAKALRTALVAGERYECARVLAGYDKDRETLLQMLTLLGEAFARLGVAKYRTPDAEEEKLLLRITPLQAAGAADAVETAMERVGRNVSVPLLCACMIEEVKAALNQ